MARGFKQAILICLLAAFLLNPSAASAPAPSATGPGSNVSQRQPEQCMNCHPSMSQPVQGNIAKQQAANSSGQAVLQEDGAQRYALTPGNLSNGRLNILLLGVDTRANDSGRADSIMLASLDPKNNRAELFSIMRDSYVTIPTRKPTQNRINTAYGQGGPAMVVKTVSNFLQLPIKYYVVTDFQGFEKAVDAIGGVDINVEKAMNYTDDGINDIHLQAGLQTLNGHQALGYARFRHDQQGDYARVARQRKLLKALLTKVQGIQAVYNLPRIISSIKPYIRTNLDFASLANLALSGCKLKKLTTHTLPSPSAHKAVMVDGMAVLVPNLDKTRREVQAILATGS